MCRNRHYRSMVSRSVVLLKQNIPPRISRKQKILRHVSNDKTNHNPNENYLQCKQKLDCCKNHNVSRDRIVVHKCLPPWNCSENQFNGGKFRYRRLLLSRMTLANALVLSCLDYLNLLLTGMNKSNLVKLQRVQNSLATDIL